MIQQKTHINKKIIEEIQDVLKGEYKISIDDDWHLFKTPLIKDDDGKINIAAFSERKEKSNDIIEKLLDRHDKIDMLMFLKKLAIIELEIQEFQPRIRDHVLHAFNTFILGVYIMKNVKFPSREGAYFDYPFMWKLCAPTHDIGYPIEFAHNIEDFCVDTISFDLKKRYTSVLAI